MLIRNVLKSQRREERRSYGINEQRQRDIIQSPSLSPSHLSLCSHTHTLPLCFYVHLFPLKLCFPFFLPLLFCRPCLSRPFFSSCKFFDCLILYLITTRLFWSPTAHPPPITPLSFRSASTPLGSCVLVGVVGGLALCRSWRVSAALAHPSAHPAPRSLINECSVVFVLRPVIC